MPAVVARITARTLEAALTRTPWVLIRLDRSPRATLHRGLADWFDGHFPGFFSFGILARAEIRADVLAAAFQTALGPLRNGLADGYSLLEAGLVVGHHVGETRSAAVRYDTDAADTPSDPVLREVARASAADAEALRQLVAYFRPIVERKLRAATPGVRADPRVRRDPTPPPPPPRQSKVDGEAYALLGVAPTATDDEVKAAYKHQLKLNHPDKVAHLSPALQKFAEQQVLQIKAAYEVILAERRRG